MLRLLIVGLTGLAIVPTSALRPHDPARPPEPPFCDRNPNTCAASGEVIDGMKVKLSLIAGLAMRNFSGDPTHADVRKMPDSAGDAPKDPSPATFDVPRMPNIIEGIIRSGTLTASDKAPAWRDPE